MSWIEKRSYFDSRNSTLGEEQINDRVSKLKKAINNYIQNTDDKRNTHFQEIKRLMTELNNIKEQYTDNKTNNQCELMALDYSFKLIVRYYRELIDLNKVIKIYFPNIKYSAARFLYSIKLIRYYIINVKPLIYSFNKR